ncbi:hypothetical protein HNR03_005821 [Pseudomonas sp. JAI111]|uniref:hypothetical protein n=1 Tax=Pseudomonas sp. JAI111 TaxID=2735913 RepID=UPI002168861D|nr:hypothetical protein [Pseudomonas sp. JAI111]MCS3841189.1 hypothetical protein [Pseudomonas sp. JAI111]
MPSLSEAPNVRGKALWLLSRFSKVTRRQGGTNSRRDRRNGYVPNPNPNPTPKTPQMNNITPNQQGFFVTVRRQTSGKIASRSLSGQRWRFMLARLTRTPFPLAGENGHIYVMSGPQAWTYA